MSAVAPGKPQKAPRGPHRGVPGATRGSGTLQGVRGPQGPKGRAQHKPKESAQQGPKESAQQEPKGRVQQEPKGRAKQDPKETANL